MDIEQSAGPHLYLQAWYVSTHRLGQIFEGHNLPSRTFGALDDPNSQSSKIHLANFLGPVLVDYLKTNGIPTLHHLCVEGRLTSGTPFIFDGHLFGKGFGHANKSQQVSLSTRKDDLPEGRKLTIDFSKSGLVTTTACSALSGSKHLFAFCSVHQVGKTNIHAVPYVVGNLVQGFDHELKLPLFNSLELQIDQVDQFRGIDFKWRPSQADLQKLQDVPERVVKSLFCELLGEATVPKDWGGEECDIFTSNMSVDGKRCTAAFLLKGPSKFTEMTMAECGKNGDQIYRLFNTPAEVFVVQHCHKISPAVRAHIRNAAMVKYSPSCKYILIDGYETAKILRAHGKLPTRTRKPKTNRKSDWL